MRAIVDDAYRAARAMMDERRDALDRLTEALLASETLSGEQVSDLVAAPAPRRARRCG